MQVCHDVLFQTCGGKDIIMKSSFLVPSTCESSMCLSGRGVDICGYSLDITEFTCSHYFCSIKYIVVPFTDLKEQ